jgi:hypothetical protein
VNSQPLPLQNWVSFCGVWLATSPFSSIRTWKRPFGVLLLSLPANSSYISQRAEHARSIGSAVNSPLSCWHRKVQVALCTPTVPRTSELPGTVSTHLPTQSKLPPLSSASGVITTIRSCAVGLPVTRPGSHCRVRHSGTQP